MFDAMKRAFQNSANGAFPGRNKHVSPDEIINQALDEAKLHAQDWGAESKKELPNLFDVTVNGWDWGEYYSRRTEEIAKRMAVTLLERIDSQEYTMEGTPVFRLYRSADPDFSGIEVRASFAGAENDKRAKPSRMNLNDAQTVKLSGGGTMVMGSSKQGAFDEDANRTVVVENGTAQAFLESGLLRLPLADGFRVGADREGSNKPAEVLLPSEGHEKTSREHGLFSVHGTQWSYVNYGANGTKVEHPDGSVECLTKGERCDLYNCDVLFFGTSTGYRFITL